MSGIMHFFGRDFLEKSSGEVLFPFLKGAWLPQTRHLTTDFL